MTTRTHGRLWFVPALALSLLLCQAEAPSGVMTFTFDSAQFPVWDISGTLQFSHQVLGKDGAVTPLFFGLDVAQDVRGHVTSTGSTIVYWGNNTLAADYKVHGQVNGGGGKATKVSLSIQLRGVDFVNGVETPFKVTLNYALTANLVTQTLDGTARGSFNASKLGSGNIRENVAIPTNPGAVTDWSVEMNIAALNRLGGTANLMLPNNRAALPATLKGSYSGSSNLSKVQLSGVNEGKGNKLNIDFTLVGSASEVSRLNGTILGQRVRQ